MKQKNKKTTTPRKPAKSKPPKTLYTGVVSMAREGYAFLVVEGRENDIFLSARKLHGALHGDTVSASIIEKKERSRSSRPLTNRPPRVDGEVVEIVSRSKRPYVGILQILHERAWLITESKNMPYDILIGKEAPDPSLNGIKAAVLITGWSRKEGAPQGELVDVLGKPGENTTEMHAILAEFGLPYRFSAEVEAEAEKIEEEITQEEIDKRRDFREVPTFTIDPADAKDFDDAISLRELNDDKWEVGIHIADVTHYVKIDSLTDKEALERGTSVYLVDRTVPMLPEKLCNRLCSLRPQEDKLSFSAVFEIDNKANILHSWFGKTLINSNYRFDYEEAQQIIKTGKGPLAKEMAALHRLATLLREKRFKLGAISFERPEYKVEVDSAGKPIGVVVKESEEANWLIEEFMLLANQGVARYISTPNKEQGKNRRAPTFVYRVHEEPNQDKITAFRDFVTHFGYKLKPTRSPRDLSTELNKLLDKVRDTPQANVIEMMALRAMARARYSTDNLGHYGLAFDTYTHFTSPIRRYPDMMAHRLLAHYMAGGKSRDKAYFETLCKHASEREQLATDAERASIKYKMIELMQDKIGQVYEGTITGLTEWGIYVEINDLHIEGMVSLREIHNDYFEFNANSYTLHSRSSGRIFHLGDTVNIRVARANLEQKLLDYHLVTDSGAGKTEPNGEPDKKRLSKKSLNSPLRKPKTPKNQKPT